jgi:hypothetical protein
MDETDQEPVTLVASVRRLTLSARSRPPGPLSARSHPLSIAARPRRLT